VNRVYHSRPVMHRHCSFLMRNQEFTTAQWEFVAFLYSSRSLACSTRSFGVHSHTNKKEDSFWIRNRIQISDHHGLRDLGSAYGNQPYRSLHEQTVPYPHAGNCAQHQCVSQYTRQCLVQHTSPCLTHSDGDHSVLLRGRSGWWIPALCTIQHFVRGGADRSGMLRGRSGWWVPALCSIQHFVLGGGDRSGMLRGRSGWWVPALCSIANCYCTPYTLSSVGRFSRRRGGQ
jgi:hypothetical protein